MKLERWQEVKSALHEAMEVTGVQRLEYLEQLGNRDAALRAELESLLHQHESAGSRFLNTPAAAVLGLAGDDRFIGRHLGPYCLIERIGTGGMGEVYRALRADAEYEQQVAVKLVRAGQDALLGARLRAERQILAAFEHPNIARLLDGGTTEEGVPYLVMELIDGRPITKYCSEHRLDIGAMLELLLLVCSAVQYAHQRKVIHRDLKPSNVLVTGSAVPKLLDFGIAKILEPGVVPVRIDVTVAAMRILTPQYASPEQIRGEPVTAASDVYSLGVILYELLTGVVPCPDGNTAEHLARAVHAPEPKKPSTAVLEAARGGGSAEAAAPSRLAVPRGDSARLSARLRGDLDNIALMALRRDPTRRYATVEQFAGDIRRHLQHRPVSARKPTLSYRTSSFVARHTLGVTATGLLVLLLAMTGYIAVDHFMHRAGLGHSGTASEPPSSSADNMSEKSIAVLPFVDLSQRKDQQYFADGMAEEIVDLLIRVPHLRVIGHISSFQFKGSNGDLRAIGDKLGAGYLVDGSVRTAGSRIRVTAQLIDARSGIHRWSQTLDRDLGDVLALQEEIASGIARALQLAVSADDIPGRGRLQSTEAYLLYLRGQSALDRLDRESLHEAQSDFEQAIALDPSFLSAAESLALAHVAQAVNQLVPSRIAWRHAREAAEAALRIDPQSASAHGVLGLLHAQYEFDWDAADAEFRKAFALNARRADTLDFAAQLAFARGNRDEAMRRMSASLSVDPLDPYTHQTQGWLRYLTGDLAGGELALRRSLEISPTLNASHLILGEILLARGRRDAALSEMLAETPDGGRYTGLAVVYFALGRKAESDTALRQGTRELGAVWPYGVAEGHAYRGERDQAFRWLSKAYDGRDPDLMFVKDDPLLESLRSDPRFKALLRKMHLPE